jgi:methylated-DNA-[protein]-cysteine S-methyltransferase
MTPSPALDARFRAAAAATGLLDAAYDIVGDTPIGDLLVGVTDRGVCRIHFDPNPEAELESLARQFGPRVLRSAKPIDRVRRQLDEYFAGTRRDFELDVDLRPAREFGRAVLDQLARVPYGEVTTYGALATEAGRPRAARAVGTVMNRNPVPIVLPCHRVVGSTGSLVGYAGGLDRKRLLLELEGALNGPTGEAGEASPGRRRKRTP